MAHGLCQFALHGDSGLPEDVFVNSFSFAATNIAAVSEDVVTDILNFYNAIPVATHKVSDYLSSALSGAWSAKVYAMADPEPRVPVFVDSGTGIDNSSSGLPSEVALCLSYQALPASGEPQARRRGRIYVGPLSEDASTGTTVPRPDSTFVTTLLQAATKLVSDLAGHDAVWSVWSRSDNQLVPISDGWVDNAFDTQRRRGERTTVRTTWSA